MASRIRSASKWIAARRNGGSLELVLVGWSSRVGVGVGVDSGALDAVAGLLSTCNRSIMASDKSAVYRKRDNAWAPSQSASNDSEDVRSVVGTCGDLTTLKSGGTNISTVA